MTREAVSVGTDTDQEEVATMYAAMLTTDYVKKEAFQRNFMASWRPLLKKSEAGKPVKDLALCDFTAIAAHLDAQYTVFGKVLRGDSVLAALEKVETKKEGIFVMPKTRITIARAVVHKGEQVEL